MSPVTKINEYTRTPHELGGTASARHLARALNDPELGVRAMSSAAGVVLHCDVIDSEVARHIDRATSLQLWDITKIARASTGRVRVQLEYKHD